MWGLLRSVVIFYLRPFAAEAASESDTSEDGVSDDERSAYLQACRSYNAKLFQFAELAEDLFGHRLCKSNLHAALCSLPKQQAYRGHAFFYTEFWLEQLVQWAKQMTKFRTTGCPEKLIVGYILTRLALDHLRAHSASNLTMEEWVDQQQGVARADTFRGTILDPGAADGTGMLGSGEEEVAGERYAECRVALSKYSNDFQDEAWSDRDMAEAKLVVYKRVQLGGGEIIHSSSYGRACSRVSYYITTKFTEHVRGRGEQEVLYVGHVRYFLMATTADGTRVLRLAIADLYKTDVVRQEVGEIVYAKGMCGGLPTPAHRGYPVRLPSIGGKVVLCAKKGALSKLPASHTVPFVSYSHVPSALG